MSRPSALRRISCLLGTAIILTAAASAADVLDLRWEGDDVAIRFSDSLGYAVDLAESDSTQLVIRLSNAHLPQTADQGGSSILGPHRREAILTRSGPNELRLTVRAATRLGYASIWRPYSNTLIVHTFDWNKLEYAQEHYYKGLLAFEQGLDRQALEMLRIAYATGDPRAASALGVYYARRGERTLAAQYLAKPTTADDYAALAAAQLKGGDSAVAASNQQTSREMLTEHDTAWAHSNATTRRNDTPQHVNTDIWNFADPSARRWIYFIGGVLLLIILIALVIWISRRSSRRQAARDTRQPAPPMPAPRPQEQGERGTAAPQMQPIPSEPPTRPTPDRPETIVVEKSVPATPVASKPPSSAPEIPPANTVVPALDPPPLPAQPVVEAEARPAVQASEAQQRRPLPTQAAELRRKIEAMREMPTPPPAPPKRTTPSSESTVAEARRLQLSRDSVELRRRLEQESGKG